MCTVMTMYFSDAAGRKVTTYTIYIHNFDEKKFLKYGYFMLMLDKRNL